MASPATGVDQPEDVVVIDDGLARGDENPFLVDQTRSSTARHQLKPGTVAGDVDPGARYKSQSVSQGLGHDDATDRVDAGFHGKTIPATSQGKGAALPVVSAPVMRPHEREAAETAIFLAEVAGRHWYTDWRTRLEPVNDEHNRGLPRVTLACRG